MNSSVPSAPLRSKARSNSIFTSEYLYESPDTLDKRLPIDFDEMWGESSFGDDISASTQGTINAYKKTKDSCRQKRLSQSAGYSTPSSPSQKKKKELSTPTVPSSPFSKTKLAKLLMKNGLQIDIPQGTDCPQKFIKKATPPQTNVHKRERDLMDPRKKLKVLDNPTNAPQILASPRKHPKTPLTPGKSPKIPSKIIHLKLNKTLAPPLTSKPDSINDSKWKQPLKASSNDQDEEPIRAKLEASEASSKRSAIKSTAQCAATTTLVPDEKPYSGDDAGDRRGDLNDEFKRGTKKDTNLKDDNRKEAEPRQRSLPVNKLKRIDEQVTKVEVQAEFGYVGDGIECNQSECQDETDFEKSDCETQTDYGDDTNCNEDGTDADETDFGEEETESETEIESTEDNPQETEMKRVMDLKTIKDIEETDFSEKQNTSSDGNNKLSREEMIEKMRALQTKFSDVLGRLSGAAEKLKSFEDSSNDFNDDYSSDDSLTVSTMAVESRMRRDELPNKSRQVSKKSLGYKFSMDNKSSRSKSSNSKSSTEDVKAPKEKFTRTKSGRLSKKRSERSSKHIVDLAKEDST